MKEENNFYCENYNNDGFADIEEKCKKQCENCKIEAMQALSQSENKFITKEEIEYRIKEEFKKHKELDWAKIAASKIYALLPQQSEGEKERVIEFAEFISKNGFYRNASETNMLWVTNDNDYYSGCLYTNEELYKEFLKTK